VSGEQLSGGRGGTWRQPRSKLVSLGELLVAGEGGVGSGADIRSARRLCARCPTVPAEFVAGFDALAGDADRVASVPDPLPQSGLVVCLVGVQPSRCAAAWSAPGLDRRFGHQQRCEGVGVVGARGGHRDRQGPNPRAATMPVPGSVRILVPEKRINDHKRALIRLCFRCRQPRQCGSRVCKDHVV